MFVTYLQAVLKLFYLDWRPAFLSTEIDSKFCEADYGKPSGHALSSTLLIPFLLHLIYKPSNWIGKITIYVFTCFILFSIIFSRLYLGKHSINQLILGVSIGMFFYVVFFNILDKWLDKNLYGPSVYGNQQYNQTSSGEIDLNLSNLSPENNEIQKELNIETSDQELISEDNNNFSIQLTKKERSIYKIMIGLLVLSNMFMIIGIFAAKHFVEFPNSFFFNSFKNCMFLKTKYNNFFSSKIVRDGGAFNLFFGIFLSHYSALSSHSSLQSESIQTTKPINIFQALKINYDRNKFHMMIRLTFILLFLCPALITFIVGPMLEGTIGVIANVSMGLGLPFICGFFLRTAYLKSLNVCNISYFQIENEKLVKSLQELN